MSQRIKQENRKAFGKFVIILFISMFAGGILGGVMQLLGTDNGMMIVNGIPKLLGEVCPFGFYFMGIPLLSTAWIVYGRCKELLRARSQEDEEVLDRVEMLLNYPILLSSSYMIFEFFFFAGMVMYTESLRDKIIGMLGYVITLALIIIIQQKAVDLLKEMNPEKKGSIYDMDFAKKWEKSCDEAEQLLMYKSSYIAFRYTTITCIVIWLLLVLLGMVYDIGILPVACVTVIWFIQTLSYCIASIKLTKKKQGGKVGEAE